MGQKRIDLGGSVSKERFNSFRGAVAESNPENFRRMPLEKASLTKIGVFGSNRETVLGRKCPDD